MDDPADLRLSSLDLIVYAYLKEELINTEESEEVKYLKENCPNLMNFYSLMDFLFTDSPIKASTDDKAELSIDLLDKAKSAKARFFRANQVKLLGPNDRAGTPANASQDGKAAPFDLGLYVH